MGEAKEKILIADDMETFLRLEKMLLERSGYEIVMAKSGGEAIKKAQSEKPRLIFLDMIMPDMNGDAVCRFIKSSKNLKQIPVIMVSTKSEPEYRERAAQAGADDYITKPVTQRDLFEKIKKFIPVDRRQHPRARVRVTALATGQSLISERFTSDLSEGGVFVETETLLEPGSDLNLEFTLPGEEKSIFARGKVARKAEPSADQPDRKTGLGISFTQVSPADAAKIRVFVDQHQA